MDQTIRRVLRHLLTWLCLAAAAPWAHALQLGISANPDRVRPGETVMVAITVTNDSAASIAAVSLRLPVPAAGVNAISQSYGSGEATCPGSICDPGEFVSWSVGTLLPGRGARVTMPLTVASTTADGTVLTLSASALVGTTAAAAVSQSVTVAPANALSLDVSADKDGVTPGATLTYTLNYGNRNGTAINGTTLALPLPANVSFVSASGGGALSGNTVIWALGTLQGGQSGRQQVRVTANASAPSGTLLPVDAAQIAATNGLGNTESARSVLVTRVQTGAALTLAIAPNSDPARPNEAVRTAFTVSNPLATPVFNVVLQARIAATGFDDISQSVASNGGTCVGSICDPREFITWNLGTLTAGGSVTVQMVNTVSAAFAAGRLIAWDAEVTGNDLPPTMARHTVAVDGDNALTLALYSDKDPVVPGDTLTYTLTYGNRGASTLTGAVLEFPLPPGVSFVSASGGGTLAGSTVRWTLPQLLAGQSTRQQVVVNVGATLAGGSLLSVNAAALTGDSATTGAEAARATLVTRVHVAPLLALAVASNADPARPNEAARTSFTVSNRSGDAALSNIVLRARVPTAGLNAVSQSYLTGGATCVGSICDPYEFATWNIGTLAPGGSVTVSVFNNVTDQFGSGRLIALEAMAEATGAATATAGRALVVDGDHALTLALHADRDSAAPGDRVTYVMDYANRSAGTISNAALTFPVPAMATLVGSSSGAMTARSVSWNLGSLLAGTGGRRSVTVLVPANSPPGTVLRVDAATMAGNSNITGSEISRATLNPRVVVDNPLQLSVLNLASNPLLPSQTLTATLQVRNTGKVPLNGVRLLARVPSEGINSFSQSVLSGGGTCTGSICDSFEFATWTVPALAADATATFTMPMPVSSGLANGTQIVLHAYVSDDNGDQAVASATAMIGTQFSQLPACRTFGDFDGNNVVGFSDLALFRSNFGTTTAAYDLDGNGVVAFADLAIFNKLFGNALTACAGNAARFDGALPTRR